MRLKHGSLISIGGREDKRDRMVILREVARRLLNEPLFFRQIEGHAAFPLTLAG